MTDESIVIVLPLPNRALSANFTVGGIGGRMMKATATRKYRRLACKQVQQEQIESLPWKKVSVAAKFFHKTKRHRDTDSAMYSLKAVYDGIVDAGVVPDDTPEYMKREEPEIFSGLEHIINTVVLTLTRIK